MGKKYRIPQYFQPKKKALLPESLAETRSEDKESSLFSISYAFYNDKMCEIKHLEKNCGREALRVLRLIGQSKTEKDFEQFGVDKKDVKEEGSYRELFNGLPEFTNLLEHKLQSTARLFYFVSQKIVCLVAITNSHIETKKVKR